MEISLAELLSEMLRIGEKNYGLDGLLKIVAERFAHTKLENPLNELLSRDKARLALLISLYEQFGHGDAEMIEKMERAAKLVRDAGKLATRFQQEWDEGSFLSMEPALQKFSEDLQSRLSLFSTEVGKIFDLAGKRGHKQKTLMNYTLVLASTFIKVKTGSYNDEHFVELLQGRPSESLFRELSGDAIRKKRDHLQKTYPKFYKTAFETATSL